MKPALPITGNSHFDARSGKRDRGIGWRGVIEQPPLTQTMTPVRALMLVIMALLLAPALVSAQDGSRLDAVAISPGQMLRVESARFGRLQGRVIAMSENGLALAAGPSPIKVPLADIDSLWVQRRATGKGALIGGAAGILVGGIYGFFLGEVACEPIDGGDCTRLEVAGVSSLLGGITGALLGAGIGFAIPSWRLRFP